MVTEAQQSNGTSALRTSFISSELLRKNGKNSDADHLAKALEIERDRLQQECDALTETLAESGAASSRGERMRNGKIVRSESRCKRCS